MTFKDLLPNLSEKRRNPELNPKIPAFQEIIDKGYNTKEYFFSFTQLKKLGINPHSEWETPNGIYAFPNDALDNIHDMDAIADHTASVPYIHIFKLRSHHGIIDPIESYTRSEYERDVKKLEHFLRDRLGKKFDEHSFDNLIYYSKDEAKYNEPIAWIWNVTRNLAANLSEDLGWKGVKDGHEVDREEEENLIFKTSKGVSSSAQGWNNLFRKALGYEGVVDRKGTGIIHMNEPCAAVFFSIRNIEVVDMIPNKPYTRIGINSKFTDIINKVKETNSFIPYEDDIFHDSYLQEMFNEAFEHSELHDCKIIYNRGNFIIEDGKIMKGNFSHKFTIDKCHIEGKESVFNMCKRVSLCNIHGGNFISTIIDDGNVYDGEFNRSEFKNIRVIVNGIFNHINAKDVIFKKGNIKDSLLKDCSFKDCSIEGTDIYNGRFDYDEAMCKRCSFTDSTINKGYFEGSTFLTSEIRGGTFIGGRMMKSIIKDGEFDNTKIDSCIDGDNNKLPDGEYKK